MLKPKSFFVYLLLFTASFFYSCESADVVTPVFEEKLTSIAAWDYSDYHYFFDTLYFRSYTEVMSDSTNSGIYSQYVTGNAISSAEPELWIQCDNSDSTKRLCAGIMMLGPMPPGGYDDSVKKPENIAGEKCFKYFRKLRQDEYYYNRNAGFTGLMINAENLNVGVVYCTADGRQYGKGAGNSFGTDTLVIKLIKSDVVHPFISPKAWKLKMKNVYRLSPLKISSGSKILLQFFNLRNFTDTITGCNSSMMTMLGLDRFSGSTLYPPPDGKFDWRPGFTVIPSAGDVYFPSLRPFSDGLVKAGVSDTTLNYFEIYDNTKNYSTVSPKAVLYYIRVSENQ